MSLKHARRHLGANAVAYLALFMAMSGTAVAGHETIFSNDIVDGEVKTVDLGESAVTGAKVADATLTGADVLNGSLSGLDIGDATVTGADVATGTLSGIDVADSSLTGTDVATNSLTGTDISEGTLSARAMGCQVGIVHGFARVRGSSGMPDIYTSSASHIDTAYNCAGGAVLVRRAKTGVYHVRFPGNPARLGLATNNADGSSLNSTHNDNVLTIARIVDIDRQPAFRVEVEDVSPGASGGSDPQDGRFAFFLF